MREFSVTFIDLAAHAARKPFPKRPTIRLFAKDKAHAEAWALRQERDMGLRPLFLYERLGAA